MPINRLNLISLLNATVAIITTKLQSLKLMRADEKLKTIMKWLRFIITLMNTVPMLNARIFITNKHDSDARLVALRESIGNIQTWRTRVECSELYHQRTRFRCSDT